MGWNPYTTAKKDSPKGDKRKKNEEKTESDKDDLEKEKKIIRKHIPNIEEKLAGELSSYVQQIRTLNLDKNPGVAETIDWAKGVMALGTERIEDALACVVKSDRDAIKVKEALFSK